MRFNENLKRLRKQENLNQSGLAKELNVTIKAVSHWETGHCEPSIEMLIKIADFFSVTLDDLVGRE